MKPGTRVALVGPEPYSGAFHDGPSPGSVGTILDWPVEEFSIGWRHPSSKDGKDRIGLLVHFDEAFIGGHNGYGRRRGQHCWYCAPANLKPVDKTQDQA